MHPVREPSSELLRQFTQVDMPTTSHSLPKYFWMAARP